MEKWFQFILDHRVGLRERMFCLTTYISIIATSLTLVMGRNVVNLAILAVNLICMIGIMKVSTRTGHINAGATAIAILLFLVFPRSFFSAGGFYSGMPQWFVLCFVYISITLEGKRKFVFFLSWIAETLLCYYVAFFYPEYVTHNTQGHYFFCSAVSVVLVGVLTSILLFSLGRLYKKENELSERQKKEIEELSKAENHFFSSMSHEIRTPINTIIGLNEIILRGLDIPEDVAENARNIRDASKMLLALINDILDLSKIKSGKMEIINVSYETGTLFSEIVNMIWIKAKEKGLEFKLYVDPSIPSMLCGDEVRIKQVLINLLNNAVKYTSKGIVKLSARCERISLNRVRVWYSVEDTGQGVKKENIPYIFNAFQRVDEEKNRHIEGTGLGLSIVHQLIKLMGGEISVNSVYTKGSTFIVMLEQDIVDAKELGTFTLESRVKAKGEEYHQSFEAPGAHILVVDDNEMNLLVVRKLLSSTKIQLDTAISASSCLRLTQTQHYDAILMDHLMPEMDGIQCLHALRTQPGGLCQNVPVIALTANAGSDNQLLYQKEGFSGYLAKPVSGALLEAAVLSILPKELVKINRKANHSKIGKDILIFEQTQRRSLIVTTDSVCDLPEVLKEKLHITVCPYYVCTEQGRFLDEKELTADELLPYMAAGNQGYSQAPAVEDYERFFAERLTQAQNVIHITMAKHVSEGFFNAQEAAKSFENVTVLDSGHLSSSLGLVVLCAAYMAENHFSKAEIVKALNTLKHSISSAFIIDRTHMMCQSGRISKRIQIVCDGLLLHPVIVLRNSKMAVGSMEVGNFAHAAKHYIRKVLRNPRSIDRRILFITYAGLDSKNLQYIQDVVKQCCPFERVYLQKASSAIASNCGAGSFGLLFMKKNETVLSLTRSISSSLISE